MRGDSAVGVCGGTGRGAWAVAVVARVAAIVKAAAQAVAWIMFCRTPKWLVLTKRNTASGALQSVC
jgi:hypothetical protein